MLYFNSIIVYDVALFIHLFPALFVCLFVRLIVILYFFVFWTITTYSIL